MKITSVVTPAWGPGSGAEHKRAGGGPTGGGGGGGRGRGRGRRDTTTRSAAAQPVIRRVIYNSPGRQGGRRQEATPIPVLIPSPAVLIKPEGDVCAGGVYVK